MKCRLLFFAGVALTLFSGCAGPVEKRPFVTPQVTASGKPVEEGAVHVAPMPHAQTHGIPAEMPQVETGPFHSDMPIIDDSTKPTR